MSPGSVTSIPPAQPLQKIRIVAAAQSGMCLLCGAKLGLNSQMNLHRAAFKPASPALGELGRLGYFDHAENALVKSARSIFFACGHCKLNVIDRKESWLAHAEILEEANKNKRRGGRKEERPRLVRPSVPKLNTAPRDKNSIALKPVRIKLPWEPIPAFRPHRTDTSRSKCGPGGIRTRICDLRGVLGYQLHHGPEKHSTRTAILKAFSNQHFCHPSAENGNRTSPAKIKP